MRNILFLLLVISLNLSAEKQVILKFRIDTVKFQGKLTPIQRVDRASYEEAMRSKIAGVPEGITKLILLEKDLSYNKKIIFETAKLKSIDSNQILNIASVFPKNNLSLYYAENEFYKEVFRDVIQEEKSVMVHKDTIKLVKDYTEKEITHTESNYDIFENSMRINHKYATQFYGMRLNFVNVRVQNYIQDIGLIYFGQPEFSDFKGYKILTENYASKFSNSNNPQKLTFKYYLKKDGNNGFIIQKCVVYGYVGYLLDFFSFFYPTIINIDDLKNKELAYCCYLGDRISFIYDSKGLLRINIDKSM